MNTVAAAPNADFTRDRLIRAVGQRYRRAGLFAYHFARSKLRSDPLFTDILALGLLARRDRILDLGCGQGLLTAWLTQAGEQHACGRWPPDWPTPPLPRSILAVDARARSIERARLAGGDGAEFRVGDIRHMDLRAADAIVILDVLHYIDYADQHRMLARARAALPSSGLLLLRVADADGGLSFKLGQWIDYMNHLVQDRQPLHVFCRSLEQWHELLRQCGFEAQSIRTCSGRSFANTLIAARPA